ncbi:MAG: XRE family transcriptional regulator [Pirellulales bacterium]|nr:XRE family transcriptional regulator [Pirellulales bacterium]
MDTAKRKAIEAAGWKVGDAADFLEMDSEERQLLDARVKLALAIRQQRQAHGLTQKDLSSKLKTTQPRVAKIERAASDVSMDQLIRAFAAAGGKFVIRTSKAKATKGKSGAKKCDVVLEVLASR